MEIVVNGTQRSVGDGATVRALIDELGFGHRQVVVELNGEPLDRSAYASTALCAGDRIEVVRAVAGG